MIQTIEPGRERVAVIGAGVAGLVAAWMLQRKHSVDLYERNHYAGGHTRTLVVQDGPDAGTPIDMGFIVMNHRNYPLLTRLLEKLDVALGDSDMSFGYQCEQTGYAYAGTNLGSLFARTFFDARWNCDSRSHCHASSKADCLAERSRPTDWYSWTLRQPGSPAAPEQWCFSWAGQLSEEICWLSRRFFFLTTQVRRNSSNWSTSDSATARFGSVTTGEPLTPNCWRPGSPSTGVRH